MKARTVASAAVIVASWILCEPTIAQANIYGCSGWANGPRGSRLDVKISPSQVDLAHAEWTPPHSGTGPMSLGLTYGVGGGGLTKLTRASVEGEIASDDFSTEGTGYILVKPVAGSIWREPFQADRHGLSNLDNTTTPYATVVVASDQPIYAGETLVHPKRLAVLEGTGSLQIIAFGRTGQQFSNYTYDLSNRQDRDGLFTLAYNRAMHGLAVGCEAADAMCECSG
jgi:hypothetical protein